MTIDKDYDNLIEEAKKICPTFVWIDDEIAKIECPNCGEEIIVDIYGDKDPCKCGKKYKLRQLNWIEEME